MVDLSAEKTFLAAAFEPTDEEMEHHKYIKREEKRNKKKRSVLPSSRDDSLSPSPTPMTIDEIIDLEDSDDDLPDMGDIFSTPVKKKSKPKTIVSSDEVRL